MHHFARIALLSFLVVLGCKKDETVPAAEPAAQPAPAPEPAPAPAPDPAPAAEVDPAAAGAKLHAEATRDILASYEAMRVKLAADSTEGVADEAKKVAEVAERAAADPNVGPHAHHYTDMATAAKAIAAADPKKVDEIRKLYGDLSKPVVEHLASDPTLAEGQHVFECPMAKGYKKWVQPSDKLENPYMGKKMLTCGSKSAWK